MKKTLKRNKNKQDSVVWLILAIDQVKQEIIIVGFTNDKNELKNHRERVDTCYVRSFLIEDGSANKITKWFHECGMPAKEAVQNVRYVGRCMLNIMEKSKT